VKELRAWLVDTIMPAEATRPFPTEAFCSTLCRKTTPQLGRLTVKAEQLNTAGASSLTDFKAAAMAERDRREVAGMGDRFAEQQAAVPPPVDSSLVDAELEVLCSYDLDGQTTAGGQQKKANLWCACRVLQVSDGTALQTSPTTGKTLSKPVAVGFVLLHWYANPEMGEGEESEEWVALLPKKWNANQVQSWRRNLEA
jgi:hypothetical protein